MYKLHLFIHSHNWINLEHIDGEEVLEIVIKFSSKETDLKERQGREEGILYMQLVWNMYGFSSLSLSSSTTMTAIFIHKLQIFKSPFPAQQFFLCSI